MSLIKRVKVRSKLYCSLWLIMHGFIPMKYFWSKRLKLLKTSHQFFDYSKFKLCGKTWNAENYANRETWNVNEVWSFPKGVLKIL